MRSEKLIVTTKLYRANGDFDMSQETITNYERGLARFKYDSNPTKIGSDMVDYLKTKTNNSDRVVKYEFTIEHVIDNY